VVVRITDPDGFVLPQDVAAVAGGHIRQDSGTNGLSRDGRRGDFRAGPLLDRFGPPQPPVPSRPGFVMYLAPHAHPPRSSVRLETCPVKPFLLSGGALRRAPLTSLARCLAVQRWGPSDGLRARLDSLVQHPLAQ